MFYVKIKCLLLAQEQMRFYIVLYIYIYIYIVYYAALWDACF